MKLKKIQWTIEKKKVFFSLSLVLWTFIVFMVILLLFFPYRRVTLIALQNVISTGNANISYMNVKSAFMGAEVSKVMIGDDAIDGKPLYEIEKVKLRWNPFSIFKGVADVYGYSSAYGGVVRFSVQDIPMMVNTIPYIATRFENVNLANYPEKQFPWCKGINGTLSGWIRREVPYAAPEKQKGSFSIQIKNGAIRGVVIKDFAGFLLPFKDMSIEGKLRGTTVEISRIVINDAGITIKGSGIIEGSTGDQRINVKLSYESTAKDIPLSGKGIIAVPAT